MKVCFLIRSLQRGGAERQCVLLAKGFKKLGHNVNVLVFYSGGDLYQELVNAGISVTSLEKQRRWELVGFLWRVRLCLRKERPDILYSLLQVSNVLAVVAKLFVPTMKAVWGVRTAFMDLSYYDWLVRFSYWLEPRLSPLADLIIVNSEAGIQYAKQKGYCTARMVVIPNGIDTDTFVEDSSKGSRLRELWGVGNRELLIGLVARVDPIKDYATFLRAADLVAKRCSQVRFVCIGEGDPAYKASLVSLAEELGLTSRIIWAGECQDMPVAYSALDLFCLTSLAEGLPNVLLEAMACGRICVVTDVGDALRIVGNTGYVVRPGDPEALCAAWLKAMSVSDSEKAAQSRMARQRIINQFSVKQLLEETSHILEAVESRRGVQIR